MQSEQKKGKKPGGRGSMTNHPVKISIKGSEGKGWGIYKIPKFWSKSEEK